VGEEVVDGRGLVQRVRIPVPRENVADGRVELIRRRESLDDLLMFEA